MKARRQFLKAALGVMAGVSGFFSPLYVFLRPLWAKERKTIIPQGTRRETLIHKNPAELDARDLEITPLKDFQTMGSTEHKVDLGKWRLEVAGRVRKPLVLTYAQVLALPSREDRVLLICPGFFANHGLWKGVRMEGLLQEAEIEKGVSSLTFITMDGSDEKFPLEEVLSGKVFLAYGVNGEALPEKNGFPLRVVAYGHYGSRWRKFVGKVKAE